MAGPLDEMCRRRWLRWRRSGRALRGRQPRQGDSPSSDALSRGVSTWPGPPAPSAPPASPASPAPSHCHHDYGTIGCCQTLVSCRWRPALDGEHDIISSPYHSSRERRASCATPRPPPQTHDMEWRAFPARPGQAAAKSVKCC